MFALRFLTYFITYIYTISESWIELSTAATMAGVKSPDRITPLPFANGEEYLRLLREAQRESNQSSRVVSLASSRRDTPRDRLIHMLYNNKKKKKL